MYYLYLSAYTVCTAFVQSLAISTCLIPVCKAPGKIGKDSGLSEFLNESQIMYSSLHNWGPAFKQLPAGAIHVLTPHVANTVNNTCARIINCTRSKVSGGSEPWQSPMELYQKHHSYYNIILYSKAEYSEFNNR